MHVLINRKVLAMATLIMSLIGSYTHSVAQEFERRDDKVMRKGLDFTFTESKEGSFTAVNKNSKAVHVARTIQLPASVNGEQVYTHTDVQASYPDSSLRTYLMKNMASELSKLDDGEYTLNLRDILVDASGVIVFFGYEGIRSIPPAAPLAQEKQIDLFNKLSAVMDNAELFKPSMLQGKKVVSFCDDKDIWEAKFKVKDHVFTDLGTMKKSK